MKIGYFVGCDDDPKGIVLRRVLQGCSDAAVRHDRTAPKGRALNMAERYEQREDIISALKTGDILVIVDLADLGMTAIDAMQCFGRVCEKGAYLKVVGDDGPLAYSTSKDGTITASLATRLDRIFRKEQGRRLKQGRDKPGSAKTGPKSRFATDLLRHKKAIGKIWGDKKLSQAEALLIINTRLRQKGLNSVSVKTIQREFGGKKKAEAEEISRVVD